MYIHTYMLHTYVYVAKLYPLCLCVCVYISTLCMSLWSQSYFLAAALVLVLSLTCLKLLPSFFFADGGDGDPFLLATRSLEYFIFFVPFSFAAST